MRYTLTVVEQLDRAASELAVDHPINNRLALILVDNATELVLHRRCTDHVQWDRTLRKLDPKQRAMARGNFIEGKLKVLEVLGDITHPERRFISSAHQYRNELYHVGLKHDDIIRAMAGQYFQLCCDLFVRLKPAWRMQSSTDRFTEVAERYLPKRNGKIDFLAAENSELADKLRSALPDGIERLQLSLATSARTSAEAVADAFDFVVQDNPGGHGETEVLQNVQWHLDFTRALEREGVEGSWIDPGYLDEVKRVRTALEATWRQRHASLPTENWLQRAGAIEAESDPLTAMDLYRALRSDMAYLEDAIMTAAGELDAWIQSEIDRARGK